MFKILVVDDEKNIRKFICALLYRHGYETLQAEDGMAALKIMDQFHVDLVVLDLMMPNLNGYELTKQLRDVWEHMPILMLTAKQEPIDKRKGFLVGTDDYMTKPFDEEELVLRIKALLRRAQIVNEHRLILGDVTLYYDSLSVTREKEEVKLPQKEFYLLFKLLSYSNITFTRLQLMDEIWGPDSQTDDHTLNVHINRLRDKFGNWPEFEIVTVRGLGYKAVRTI